MKWLAILTALAFGATAAHAQDVGALGASAFRDYNTAGDPTSGGYNPDKSAIRDLWNTQAAVNASKVTKTGDAMTGPLRSTLTDANSVLLGPDGLNQILFGSFGSQNVWTGADPGSHTTQTHGVSAVVKTVTGSGAFGPAANDYTAIHSLQKKNYLTSAVEGELDTNWNIVRQGAKGDASIFENYAHKVKGSGADTGSVLTSESEVAWENTSGLITQDIHSASDGFLDSATGLSIAAGGGYGSFHEARAGLTFSADHSDILPDNGATFATTNNLTNTGWCWIKTATIGRALSGFYFGIRGPSCLTGAQQRGDVVVGIVGNQTTMRTDSTGKWSIRNNADTGDMLAVTQDGAINLAQFTAATLPTCNSGAKGKWMAVSDATAPTYNGTLTGGGAVSVPVYCNGSNWTTH
jgi:hypothetical protein